MEAEDLLSSSFGMDVRVRDQKKLRLAWANT